jgi:AGCS family alanine or glycine:cation symporter
MLLCLDSLNQVMHSVVTLALGWPLIIFVAAASLFCTVAYGLIQFRYFVASWKLVLFPSKLTAGTNKAELSPLQAFINSLGMSLGNGVIAGVATSICIGGPGAIFWLAVTGLFLMAIRFAEIYLSIYYQDSRAHIGGPTIYLKNLFAGKQLSLLYTILALCYANLVGNAIQVNAISVSLQTIADIKPLFIAIVTFFFVLYVMLGGAQRILKISDTLVPFKVGLFFISSIIVLIYHWQSLFEAIKLICVSAFSSEAFLAGTVGYSVQQAIRSGMLRCIMATEAGLGTSGILYGATESKKPVDDAIMSMLTVFISTVVCFLVGLSIVVSGVWDCGLTSTALTITSYKTVFGVFGGIVVTTLAMSFGMGLIVSYGFIARELWLYLTSGRHELLGSIIYCLFATIGALCNAHILWVFGDLINAGMIVLNILGILMFNKVIKDGIAAYQRPKKHN